MNKFVSSIMIEINNVYTQIKKWKNETFIEYTYL